MDNLALIVTPALLTALVEFGKGVGVIPAGKEKLAVFLLATLFGLLYFWNKDLTAMAIAILGFGLASIGSYEAVVKPIKKAFNPIDEA